MRIYIYMMNMLIIYLIICFILSAKSFIAYHLGVHKCREMDMVDRGYGTAGTCRHPERPTEGAWVKVHILYNFIYIYKINTRLYTKVSRKGGLRGAETKRE